MKASESVIGQRGVPSEALLRPFATGQLPDRLILSAHPLGCICQNINNEVHGQNKVSDLDFELHSSIPDIFTGTTDGACGENLSCGEILYMTNCQL